MLKKIQSLASYHLQAASNSLTLLCQRPLATVATIIVIAIALTLPALLWIFTDNVEQLTAHWKEGGHISLYLKPSLSTAQQTTFLEQLRVSEGIGQVSLKTPAQGLAELEKQEGMQNIMRYLPENPLPAVIEVTPALTLTGSDMMQLYDRLKLYPEVEQAKMDREWISRLDAIVHFLHQVTQALMVLLALAVILIIGNTLRLAIHNRYEEIQVLKLIGATDSFIARPFLYSGLWYSLVGAVLAVLFVNIFMLSVAVAIKELAAAYQMSYPILGLSVRQAYLLVLIAIFLGWLGAKLSINRQLALIEAYS